VIRIISGTHKGRRLQAPKNLPVRPTTDRAKEALFNILASGLHWPEASVLDLYAGTGNISYECASRGCPSVVAVDAHMGCVKFIEKTAAELGLHISVYRRDVIKFLGQCGQSFDLIFADPPYEATAEALGELVSTCLERGLLKPGGVLVLEHASSHDLGNLRGFQEVRRYGSTHFSFFSGNT
jgi:16S rRNA (guanine(966)-N(2))-methyltransferase RsmD